jgi:hypothetical protein
MMQDPRGRKPARRAGYLRALPRTLARDEETAPRTGRSIDTEPPQGACDEAELGPGVMLQLRLPRSWYTAPPPDTLRRTGSSERSETSTHGFWLRPTTTQGSFT